MEDGENSVLREGILFENGKFRKEQRTVAREQLWSIIVNGREKGSLACSGPTEFACKKAEETGISLVCQAGEDRLCVYSCPERIQSL